VRVSDDLVSAQTGACCVALDYAVRAAAWRIWLWFRLLSLPLAGETRAQASAHFAAQGALKGLFSIVLIVQLIHWFSFLETAVSDDPLHSIFMGSQYALFYSRIVAMLFMALFLALICCCKPVDRDEQVLSFVTGQISLTPTHQAAM
jgi:hypothetical protein